MNERLGGEKKKKKRKKKATAASIKQARGGTSGLHNAAAAAAAQMLCRGAENTQKVNLFIIYIIFPINFQNTLLYCQKLNVKKGGGQNGKLAFVTSHRPCYYYLCAKS